MSGVIEEVWGIFEKFGILKTIKDNNIGFSILIQGYKDFYLLENKPIIIKTLEVGLAKLLENSIKVKNEKIRYNYFTE